MVLRFMCDGSENIWDILTEICSSILWHENAIGGLRNLFTHSRRAMKISPPQREIMKFLASRNISTSPSTQYLLTTPLPNRINVLYCWLFAEAGIIILMLACVLQKSYCNVTYSLSTATWICIYLIVVNKHSAFYLAALTNKINTLYLYYCIQYAILVVFLFFLIYQRVTYLPFSREQGHRPGVVKN